MSSTIKVNNIKNLAGDDSGIDLSTNDQIILKTANTTAITVNSSQNVAVGSTLGVTGLITASAGVAIGGTGSANTLDDYEEGTFTGALEGSTTNPSTAVTVAGTYTKIGNMCYAQAQFTNVNSTGSAGGVRVTGLPFTASGSQATGNVMTYVGMTLSTTSTNISPYVSGTTISFYQSTNQAGWSEITHNAGTGTYISFSVFYKTT
jgi:hypothetical protein